MAIGRFIRRQARDLHPGCFAAVMATGIASIDAGQHGLPWLARALLVLNGLMFAWMLALSLLRLACFRRAVVADFLDPTRGAGYFTFVAAACVLGSQCLQVLDLRPPARLFELVATQVWLVVIYLFFASAITRPVKVDLKQGINGGWLVAVVATQALSVLAILLAAPTADPGLLFAALCLYLLGGALYLLIITLVVYRMVFFPMPASELSPPYWINMGALAISTLAGSLFVLHTPDASPLADLVPFVKGFTLFFWATATWWIPLLAILWIWRHLLQRVPLRYDAADWNIVFPIGMYAVATFELGRTPGLGFLAVIPAVGVHVNLLVWALVAFGFVSQCVMRSNARPATAASSVSDRRPRRAHGHAPDED